MTPREIADVLDQAADRAERTRLADQLAHKLGVTRGTVLRKARAAGSRGNRKIREDAGSSRLKPHHAKLVAGAVARTQRLNGQVVAPIKEVVGMLKANGQLPDLATSTICRHLREQQLSKREMKARPTWRSRSTKPGQVFMLDSSTSLQWRYPVGPDGPMAEVPASIQMRQHKPEVMGEMKLTIKRYFVIDHASGYTYGRYFYTHGETELDTITVLLQAFAAMGVPRRMYVDRGPGNAAFATKYLLWLLDVQPIFKGGPDAHTLGRIDGVHNQVQQGLEWRFALDKPQNLEQSNRLLDAWLHRRNCVAVHRAAGRTRHEMYLMAQPGVIRRLPEHVDLPAHMLSRPETRNIDGRGNFSWHGLTWRVDNAELFNTTQFISLNPFKPGTLLVLRDFDMDTLQCSARYEAVEDPITAFGLPESAAELLHDHPIGARKPAFVGEIKAAKRYAREAIAANQVDVYADLQIGGAGTPACQFSEQRLARQLAAAPPVDVAGKERTYDPRSAIIEVSNRFHKLNLKFTDGHAAALESWRDRDAIPASEIERFVTLAAQAPDAAEGRSA